ncbi:MAG: efflux RND transporter periplasmic adaptor subunit [Candidatus Kapabacteria bacterium]|nr:efflux RND transporter periplasmic adaptor subunit [Candidatus Kapabacteria bacterium]
MKLNIKILLAVIFQAFILLGCGEKESPKIEEKHKEGHEEHTEIVKLSLESLKLINIESETVSLQPMTGYISLPATIVPNQDNEALVGSLVQGRVQKVNVKIGDYVKAGQVLMTVEGLDIGTIKAGFLKAKANLDFTKSTYERQKKLFDEKIGSQKSLLESQAEYEKALAEFKAEDKRIHSIGLSDDDILNGKSHDEHTSGTLPIKSPINGIVVERNIVVGQLIETNTNAFKVINTSSVWIDGQVFEKDLNKITQKTSAVFISSAYPNENFTGKVIYIGQSIDENSRTLLIRGEFSNTQNKLKPQMFGELKIPIGDFAQALLIPEEALVKEGDKFFVFIKTTDTTFEQRFVSIGSTSNNRIEIREGLKEGENVITEGVFYLNSEMKKEELEGHEH